MEQKVMLVTLLLCTLTVCHAAPGIPSRERSVGMYDGRRLSEGLSFISQRDGGDSASQSPGRGSGPSYMTGGGSDVTGYIGGAGRRTFMSGGGGTFARGDGRGRAVEFPSGTRDSGRFRSSSFPGQSGVSRGHIHSRTGGGGRQQTGRLQDGASGMPREGYIGARGGENFFPIHGGYCAGEMCADGGLSAGVGQGIGMGTETMMNQRARTGRNEDIRMYESMAAGTSGGGMGGPMGGHMSEISGMGVPMGGGISSIGSLMGGGAMLSMGGTMGRRGMPGMGSLVTSGGMPMMGGPMGGMHIAGGLMGGGVHGMGMGIGMPI